MRTAVALLMTLTISACGITTSPPEGLGDEIESAAAATAALDAYEFNWTAEYELSDADDGGSDLMVTGYGVVDAGAGEVDSVINYDEDLIGAAETLFPDDEITRVQAFTRIIGESIYVRGFNVASLSGELTPSYDTWYEITERSQDLGDPFVRTDVLPADPLTVVVEPLVDAGELSVEVDRDFVLDLGTRFARSLYDFGFRIGGGDFTLSVELDAGRVSSMTLDGDDPGSGVDRFTFTIEFTPTADVAIFPPEGAVTFR